MPGYLRKNGVPFSEKTTLTEYWDLLRQPSGEQWIVITTVVEDPTYLTRTWITSLNFKKEPDGSRWDPIGVRGKLEGAQGAKARRCEGARESMKKIVSATAFAAMLVAGDSAFAQGQVEAAAALSRGQVIDLAGSWANRLHEDWVERAPGPHIGDYSGLPINDEARAYADLYQVSMQNMPERQCILYTSQYIVMGPQNLRIEPEVDPISGAIVALHMTGTVDRAAAHGVDGRPPAPVEERSPYRGRIHDRRLAGRDDRGTDDAPEDGPRVAERRAPQRSGHHHRGLRPAWRHAHGHDDPRPTRFTTRSRSSGMRRFELDPQTRVLPEPCEPQVEIPARTGRSAALPAGGEPVSDESLRRCSTCRSRPFEEAPRRPIRSTGRN